MRRRGTYNKKGPTRRGVDFCFIVILLSCLIARAECKYEKDPSTSNIIEFLAQHTSAEENYCIDEALHWLDDVVPRPVLADDQLAVVAKFLDHERILSDAEKNGIEIRFRTKADLYPAIDVLFLGGKRSTKQLLPILANPVPSVLRDNAAFALLLIYREDQDQGVRSILEAAAQTSNSEMANNLKAAAKDVARKCSPSARKKCLAVVNE